MALIKEDRRPGIAALDGADCPLIMMQNGVGGIAEVKGRLESRGNPWFVRGTPYLNIRFQEALRGEYGSRIRSFPPAPTTQCREYLFRKTKPPSLCRQFLPTAISDLASAHRW